MTWGDVFVELDTKLHDRNSFECGKEELNEFIKTKASKHMKAGISRTMLLPASTVKPSDTHQICSFYTITPGSISRDNLPEEQAKKLPHYPIPIFLIAQLAVHQEHHGKGLGKITLIKALEHLSRIHNEMRAYAVIVDCLDEEAKDFYSKYGFEFLCERNKRIRMYLPMKSVIELFQN